MQGKRHLPFTIYDLRFTIYDLGSSRALRGMRSGGGRDVVEPCADVVTKRREAVAADTAYVRFTMDDVRFGL